MQSVDLTETYAYEMSRDLVSEKQESKCNNKNQTIQNMMKLDDAIKKNIKNITQIGHKFQIIYTEY